MYRSYTSLYVSHTSGTGRIIRVPNLMHTLDHISPMIPRVYLVYTDWTLCTWVIRHTPGRILRVPNLVIHKTIYHRWYIWYAWCTLTICCVRQPYVLYRSKTGRILGLLNLVHTLDHISPMIHRVYLVNTDNMRCTSAIRQVVYFVYQIWCLH